MELRADALNPSGVSASCILSEPRCCAVRHLPLTENPHGCPPVHCQPCACTTVDIPAEPSLQMTQTPATVFLTAAAGEIPKLSPINSGILLRFLILKLRTCWPEKGGAWFSLPGGGGCVGWGHRALSRSLVLVLPQWHLRSLTSCVSEPWRKPAHSFPGAGADGFRTPSRSTWGMKQACHPR